MSGERATSDGPALPEVWLRGPLPSIHPTLQPVAHAVLQARDEVDALLADFPDALLWDMPGGVASPGFHLQHMCGVIDRLSTYARGAPLSEWQLARLRGEGKAPGGDVHAARLVEEFAGTVDRFVAELRAIDPGTLHDVRTVGRAQLPSTVLGLLVHAAEHTMRHVGQLLVTVRVLRATHP